MSAISPGPMTVDDYKQLVGDHLGFSEWFHMDQPRVDGFAKVTEDRQFIHVDPAAAAATPLGGTIAHGFLSLSMLGAMGMALIPPIVGATMTVNYGLNNVRFLSPVRVGKRVRGSFTLQGLEERGAGRWQSSFAVTVEIEAEDRPALAAEWLILTVLAGPVRS